MKLASKSQPTTSEDALEETAIHDVLRNERRRMLISLLVDDEVDNTLRQLSERIAEREAGVSPAPRDLRQSVYVSLQQTHVPKLTKLGIAEYDPNGHTVTLSEHAEDVTVHLEVVPGYHLAWSEYYFGVGLLGLLTVVATSVGVPVVSEISAPIWAVAFFAIVVASAAYHTYTLGGTVFHRARGRNRGDP